jgi:acyl carrier protein
MNRENVFSGVCECLADVLDIPAAPIRAEQKIIDDLGADSLDLLDLTFNLEQKFRVSISPRDIERRAKEKLDGHPLEIEGRYTPEALAELRKALPEIPAEELADGLTVADLPRKFRVATMVNLVCRLLEEKRE